MAEIYDYETGDELTAGLQGSSVCDEAIQAARWLAADRGEPVELHDDDGEWLVHPDGDCERLRPSLAPNADTTHADAREMYDAYGWHISTDSAGDIGLQAIAYDWINESDDDAVLDAHRDDLSALTDDEALSLIAKARSVRDDMEGVESLLDDAVAAYEAGDVAATILALDKASSAESEHGDDPATASLRSQLVLED